MYATNDVGPFRIIYDAVLPEKEGQPPIVKVTIVVPPPLVVATGDDSTDALRKALDKLGAAVLRLQEDTPKVISKLTAIMKKNR